MARSYRPEVLAALSEFGFAPRAETPPERVRVWLRDLYNFELREANHRFREARRVLGPQPIAAQRQRVAQLRGRYWLLSLPVAEWLAPSAPLAAVGGPRRTGPGE